MKCDHWLWDFNPIDCANCKDKWEQVKTEYEKLRIAYEIFNNRRQSQWADELAIRMKGKK